MGAKIRYLHFFMILFIIDFESKFEKDIYGFRYAKNGNLSSAHRRQLCQTMQEGLKAQNKVEQVSDEIPT